MSNKEELYDYVKTHYWSVYRNSSSILSSSCRQLALAVGGICWLIKSNSEQKFYTCQINIFTNIILILLVLFFVFDAAQYFISSLSYKKLARDYDSKITSEEFKEISQLVEPQSINILPIICFSMKILLLIFSSFSFIYLLLKI